MKHLIIILATLTSSIYSHAQFFRPSQSEAVYKQLRSMETGPWEFAPEGYYYSWYTKTIPMPLFVPDIKMKVPGMGIHDRGFAGMGFPGDRYVRKYKPSGQVRAKMFALAEITRKQYEAIAEKYKEIGERETLDATDRQVNAAIKIYETRFNALYANIHNLCTLYDQYSPNGSSRVYREELVRIQNNISWIGKSYIRNAERSAAYIKEIKNLERLSKRINTACKKSYVKHRTTINNSL